MQQRQIKFRAWDGLNQSMYRVINTVDFHLGFLFAGSMDMPIKAELGQVVLEQFTGLLDKNGEEIYEGDIVRKTYSNVTIAVEFGETAWSVSGWLLMLPARDWEVIGNIHENPELIESGATEPKK